ncbi:hypothetical protein [Jannaschia formosa]|uniref:hypothetical protein n=1 Tax=Jannaschia formosa TaxID=2259592 RepID=UPI0010750A58|nr:hypothetical protein [Jannaschia formosa]TFL17148.1 hypothetical protein DR046_15825 [Jannaschia formosa]
MADLAKDGLAKLCARLNGTPRKRLGYATPAEAFAAEMERITRKTGDVSQPKLSPHRARARTAAGFAPSPRTVTGSAEEDAFRRTSPSRGGQPRPVRRVSPG